VRQAALVGIPDAVLGARPTAFVTVHDGMGPTPAALRNALDVDGPYDLDQLVVTVVSELPMTPTGKIAKSELVAQATAGRLRA
jgi:acyl-CoA synthetase (AMP-forming)/AMP-acid ligase II